MTPYHSNKKYVGIDPGKSGGIMVIDELGEATAYKCPEEAMDMSVLFSLIVGNTFNGEGMGKTRKCCKGCVYLWC